MAKNMKYKLRDIVFLLLTAYCSLSAVEAQTPTVEKIDPPNWWAQMSINPVRVLVRGTNLSGANVVAPSNSGLKSFNFRHSENGHYLFFDVEIAPNAKVGKYNFKIETKSGMVNAPFEISQKISRTNRFQGYTPDDVIYFLMPDRFADGDRSNNDPAKSKGLYDRAKGRHYHGGDLQGVIDKLPYLKSLGVTAIWTTPVYDNNDQLDTKEVYENVPATTGYHGYGATDMYAIDEHLGDPAKLRELIDKAHALGLKVIQDQVANHTGPYHVWASDPPTATWWNGTLENHLSNNWQKWTAMNSRATYQTQKRNIDGWFINILPDFNQDDPEVEKYLIQNSIWWLESNGFDAIRMDTLPHVPRTFWQKWGGAIKREYPGVNILGELYDGDPALISYFQTGRRGRDGIDTNIDTLYDFALFYPLRNAFAQGKNIREISQMFARDWLYPNPNVLTTFIGVHDMPRFMNETGATVEGLKMAQTLIMTSRGTPLLYYGDELAMRGGGDPDNRRDFPGGFPGDNRNAFTDSGRTAEENEVWNHLAALGKLRLELEPLRKGKTLDLLDEEQQMAYVRSTEKEAVIVIFNNDTKPANVEFKIETQYHYEANGYIYNSASLSNKESVGFDKLKNGTILTDRLGKVSDIKIENRMVKVTLPARTAGVFAVK
ncbi:MAG: cyclomaltodextrinase N-terminal domain-containing protein [Pyrinomonadaceae bacterium]|nr:cyclomaltodextrinase N-terminal domain-containing protein [Pyrinomonadaceae bacterium]